MRKEDSVKAGLFIVVTISLLAIVIFVMGSDKQIFADQEEYFTSFTDVMGLTEGAPVRLAGITVGRVSEISFSSNNLDPKVQVKFLINKKYLDRMFADSSVTIETQGLLGDRFLNISHGKERKLAPAGATIPSDEPADIAQVLTKAGKVVDNTVEISNNFNDIVKDLKGSTLDDVGKAASSIANLANEIEKGEGLFHRLIYSKKDGEEIAKGISSASQAIGDITEQIRSGQGVLHSLIYAEEGSETIKSISEASRSISAFADSLTEIANEIKNGHGLANQLIYGESPDGMDDIITKLNQTAENLKKASEAITQGSGTLGSLIIDSQLYDNLVEVTEGAKRSFILRQAIRSSLDK